MGLLKRTHPNKTSDLKDNSNDFAPESDPRFKPLFRVQSENISNFETLQENKRSVFRGQI